jgi:hypothetical protein
MNILSDCLGEISSIISLPLLLPRLSAALIIRLPTIIHDTRKLFLDYLAARRLLFRSVSSPLCPVEHQTMEESRYEKIIQLQATPCEP